jgi:riboflavin kinase/FMN adenylyltransferase
MRPDRLAIVQRWHGLDAVPTDWGHCVVTIGVFDGVHRGHEEIVGRAVTHARERGVPSLLMTFVPHPTEVLRPGSHPPVLTTIVRRAELVEQLGIDVFLALPFTLEFSQLPAAEFVHRALVERLHASGVVVGENFRYGHKAKGDVAELQRLGVRFGFTADGVTLLRDGETTLSATYVRSCVQAGDMGAAAQALGRPHRVDGIVERGDRRGRDLGFPTANLRTEQWAAVPADGVYAGRVVRLDEWGRTVDGPPLGTAAISVGTNPTFEVRQRRVEAYVLDFDGDLYGDALGVEFRTRLRGMERFDSVEALVAQMHEDVSRTREIVQS